MARDEFGRRLLAELVESASTRRLPAVRETFERYLDHRETEREALKAALREFSDLYTETDES